MRDLSDEERALAHRVWDEAEARGWPKVDGLDFSGKGFLMAWGPGLTAWFDVLRAAEPADLQRILLELRSVKPVTRAEPVYPLLRS